jgi:hypothetical protein
MPHYGEKEEKRKSKGKLGKMRMPERREEPEMDLSELEAPAEEPEMEMAGEEMASEEPMGMPQLESASDEELLAEVRKRGLTKELEKEEAGEMQPEEDLGMA